MVDGLDGGNAVDAEAFVGGVQAGVGDSEAGGSGDTKTGEVVANIGWAGNSGFSVEIEGVCGFEQRQPQW